MATTCKHWVVHRKICCGCKSRVETNDLARMKQTADLSPDPDCSHRMYSCCQCCRCGYRLKIHILDERPFPPSFGYIIRHLQLSFEFAASTMQQKLRIALGQKKLHLVLALEHTLVARCIKLSQIDPDDSGLLRDDVFRLPYKDDILLVKFRPFVREFLSEAKEFFTMHVFTDYGPDEAEKLVSLVDPHMVYFGHRVITSRDRIASYGVCGLKSLNLVLSQPRGVIILDYEPRSWRKRDHSNLVISPKYEYFQANSNKVVHGFLATALNFFKNNNNNKVFEFEGKREEEECSGGEYMTVLLTKLKAVHELFFNEGYHDVTHVLPRVFDTEELVNY